MDTRGTPPAPWTVAIAFRESEDHTRADATLDAGIEHFHGWGRARRSPGDPDRPRVGEEIAAARALESLVGQLRVAAEHSIEDWEGHSVRVHV